MHAKLGIAISIHQPITQGRTAAQPPARIRLRSFCVYLSTCAYNASTTVEEDNMFSSSLIFVFSSYNDISRIEFIKFDTGGIDFHQNFAIFWCFVVFGTEMWTQTPSTAPKVTQQIPLYNTKFDTAPEFP
jgi:hypothetical protein